MREDIKQLLESRPIWHIVNDPVLRDLKAAREIAAKEHDTATVEILDAMIEEQTAAIKQGE